MVSNCTSCPIRWVSVFARWKVWESLKTLNCEIMLLFDSLCIGYGHISFVWIRSHLIVLGCISFFIWASCVVLDSVLLVQLGAAVLQSTVAASTCVRDLSYASRIYFLDTVCSTPQRHRCRGSPNFHFTKCESWPLMPSWEFNSLFTYLGEALHPWLEKKNLSYSFHIFCKL